VHASILQSPGPDQSCLSAHSTSIHATGPCSTGGCGNVRLGGLLPERYVITTSAAYNGTECPESNGATRFSTACTNRNPCRPVACNGTWLAVGPCQAPCQATGVLPEKYMVYSNAVDGGNPCPAANQTIRNTTACTSVIPCPVNCIGSWLVAVPCNASCSGSGFLTERFLVTTPAAHGGIDCAVMDGAERELSCTNSNPCPVDCQGSWVTAGSCQNASCGGGQGLLPEMYSLWWPCLSLCQWHPALKHHVHQHHTLPC